MLRHLVFHAESEGKDQKEQRFSWVEVCDTTPYRVADGMVITLFLKHHEIPSSIPQSVDEVAKLFRSVALMLQ